MKSINRILGRAILAFGFLVIFFIGQGDAFGALNANFTITATDNSVNATAWNLKYAESENAFTITMTDNNGEKIYNVRSKFIEVAYVMNKKGFGARLVKASNAQVQYRILEKILNMDELVKQKIICAETVNNETALNLIASYLPDLINNNYKHLLN